jgi:DNA repair exonuclease SbcCD ATPase subunit
MIAMQYWQLMYKRVSGAIAAYNNSHGGHRINECRAQIDTTLQELDLVLEELQQQGNMMTTLKTQLAGLREQYQLKEQLQSMQDVYEQYRTIRDRLLDVAEPLQKACAQLKVLKHCQNCRSNSISRKMPPHFWCELNCRP